MSFRLAATPPSAESEEQALQRCQLFTTASKLRMTSSRMLAEKDSRIAANYNDLMAEATADFEEERLKTPKDEAPPWYATCVGNIPFFS